MESKNVTKGITCPSCGRKDAVIENYEDEPDLFYISHQFCGHYQRLDNYLKSMFKSTRSKVDISKIIRSRVISITVDGDYSELSCVVNAIEKVSAVMGSFFQDVQLFYSDKLENLFCPLCSSIEYVGDEHCMTCKCGHFHILAEWYLKAMMEGGGFQFYPHETDPLGFHFNVSTEKSFWGFFSTDTGLVGVSSCIYRYVRNTGERILVVDQKDNSPKQYQRFLDFIQKNLGEYFKIIEKI